MNYVWTQNKASFLWAMFSFGVTVSRLFMATFIFFAFLEGGITSPYLPIFIILTIIFMDHVDGKLFEKTFLYQIESWRNGRRIFDSISDRLCIQLFCIPILVLQPDFFIVYIAILLKEILTSINCIKAYNSGIVLSSNCAGKLSCVTIGVAVIMWLLHLYVISYCMSPVILIMGCFSYIEYNKMYKQCTKNTNK